MSEQKIYVPKANAKKHIFQNGGSVIKIGFKSDALIDFVRQHTNDRGYINFVIAERREVGNYGETHTVTLDTYKPKAASEPGTKGYSSQVENARQSNSAPPPEEDDVPF